MTQIAERGISTFAGRMRTITLLVGGLWTPLVAARTATASALWHHIPPPVILPIPRLVESRCPSAAPRSTAKRRYPVTIAHGYYNAFGPARLLPVDISVKPGDDPELGGMDQILGGAETTFVLPSATILPNGPNPVQNLHSPHRPMIGIYFPRTKRDTKSDTTSYKLPITSTMWEIATEFPTSDKTPVACLYFHMRRAAKI